MLLYFGCKDTDFILVTHSIYFTNTLTHSRIPTFKKNHTFFIVYFGCKDTIFISSFLCSIKK